MNDEGRGRYKGSSCEVRCGEGCTLYLELTSLWRIQYREVFFIERVVSLEQ